MVLVGGIDQEKDRFSLFGDMLISTQHTIGSEIILGTTDVTPT
jgi:hypothetical protein